VLFFVGVVGAGLVGGVGAEQVVEGVAAGGVLGQQVGGGQFAECGAGLLAAGGGEAGGGRGGGVALCVRIR
jgi:hypothetical protein